MAVSGSSADARELGAGLRRLRAERGLTTRELGSRIGLSSANFTHWETGERLIREDHLVNILDVLEPDDDERERLLGLHRRAGGPGALVAGTPSIGEQLVQLIQYEQIATRLIDVAPLMIPGLLQTAEYARATFAELSDVDTRVALRIGRQQIITRTRQPVDLVAYIDSEALVRPIAPSDIMVDQWRHLLEMAQRPNIDIRLVSSMGAGYNPLLAGPFMWIEFPSAAPIIHLEHYRASAFLWEQADVLAFSTAVEKISAKAMTSAATAEVIASIINGTVEKT
jgi:transcriptional regulator with XRE-family HTH domain